MYKTIVVGTDNSPTAEAAVAKAAALAAAFSAALHVVSAVREPAAAAAVTASGGPFGAETAFSAIDLHEAAVNTTVDALRARGIDAKAWVYPGGATETILRVADQLGADLIVVGDKGLGGLRGLAGSVPGSITRKAPIDVYVAHTS